MLEYFKTQKETKKNKAKAEFYLEKAVSQKNPDAMYQFYLHYKDDPKKKSQASHWLREAAELGLPAACAQVALDFERGENLAEAIKWWNLAAQKYQEEKNSASEGMCLQKVTELDQQLKENEHTRKADGARLCAEYKSLKLQGSSDAIDTLCKAADLGNPEALSLLGEGLEDETLIKVLKKKGEEAEQRVYNSLGLEKGREVEQLYQRAKEGGFARAFLNLARFKEKLLKEGDEAKAKEVMELYEEAGKRGIPEALMTLGAYYEEGAEVEEKVDDKERMLKIAIEYYQKAADLNMPEACFKLALWHEGRSEFGEASDLYQKASLFMQNQKGQIEDTTFEKNQAVVKERLAAVEQKKIAARCETLLKTADEEMGQKHWKAALEKYQETFQTLQTVGEIFLPGIENKKAEIQEKERNAHIEVLLEEAKEAEKKNWLGSVKKYEAALQQLTGPGNEARRTEIEKMRQQAQGQVYLENAKKFFKNSEWDNAIKEYKKALKIFPEMKIEELEKARCEEFLQKAEKNYDDGEWASAVQNFEEALSLYRAGISQEKAAIEEKKNAAEYNLVKNLAEGYEKDKNWESAIQEYEKILKLPDIAIKDGKEKIEEKKKKATCEKLDQQAKDDEKEGKLDLALEEYKEELKMTEVFAKSGEVNPWQAMVRVSIERVQGLLEAQKPKEQPAKVGASQEPPLAVEPSSAEACWKEAESSADKGEWRKAVDMYEKAFTLESKEAGENRAKIDAFRVKYSDAFLNLVASLEAKAKNEEDWKFAEGMYKKARALLQECLQKDPVRFQAINDQNAEGYKKCADWYETKKQFQEAANMYGNAIALIVENRKTPLGWLDKINLTRAQKKAKNSMIQADRMSIDSNWQQALRDFKAVWDILERIKPPDFDS